MEEVFQDTDEELEFRLDDPANSDVVDAQEDSKMVNRVSKQEKLKENLIEQNPKLHVVEAAKEKSGGGSPPKGIHGADLPPSSSKKWSDIVEEVNPKLGETTVAGSKEDRSDATKKEDQIGQSPKVLR